MSDQINRIKELMNLKIITEGIEPQVARGFRDFFEHIISKPSLGNIERAEVDRLIKNTTSKEIKNLSAQEVETLMKNIDYESLIRTLLNKGLLSTQAKRNFFRNYINAISQNRMTIQQTIDVVENNKYLSSLYNSSRNIPLGEPVPQFVTKMEQEFNKVLTEEYENELRQSGFRVPTRSSVSSITSDIVQDRTKLLDYLEKEISRSLGKKIPRQEISKFADELFKIINEESKKFEPEFELLFKDMEQYVKGLDSKTKKEYLTKTFNDVGDKISKNSKIKDTIKKNVVDYFKSGLGVKEMIDRISKGEKIWDVYSQNMKIALSTAAFGTLAQMLRGQNPVKEFGGLTEWGRAKYFLTIIPGINTFWGISYAAWQTIALGAEIGYEKFAGSEREGKGGQYAETISIDEAKDFVMNKNGLENILPSEIKLSQLKFKGAEKGRAIDIYNGEEYITTLIKDCSEDELKRVKNLGKCKVKIR